MKVPLGLTVLLLVAAAACGMQVAIPSYFYPAQSGTNLWRNIVATGAGKMPASIALLNPNNGPGSAVDQNYLFWTNLIRSQGTSVLGYVYTRWGDTTQRREEDIRKDIDAYYSWYNVDGIFFDEAATSCDMLSYYSSLNSYVKGKGGKAVTVTNPGTLVPEVSYMRLSQ